ncbi:leucine-rich repeat domain-containing protein [Prevotella sp. P2-180]|uniref:leucine-rich repeat domain-containing protein n=1 Tax=Prevotella sp. P2-180 TaxID=2024224 RepID=UPI000B961F8B|nr:leucine-rich repeat domain-containing protein [Prevotella sp. P2-180]OYP64727.1 hypothetical protein CIK98_10170 [Prevotella sp. P2-180]
MNKRFTSLLTTLLLSVFFSISASAYDVEVDGIYYNIVTKGKAAEVTKGDNNYSGDVTIPETITVDNVVYNVTSIGREAFWSCTGLTSITIPNSLTSIGGAAFSRCPGLTSITIPNSVTSIGDDAFSYCTGLTSITIPSSVTSIRGFAFQGCTGLTSITIPNSVTSIGNWAFSYCTGLTSITIPNSVTSIRDDAFMGCTGLTSITIPNSVKSIRDGAFIDCTGLTSITIPSSVTSIGQWAFSGCKNIENVYCYAATVPSTEINAFEDAYIEYATLHVPESAINAYKTTEPWSAFGTFKTLEGTGVEKNKCETPTIAFIDGKLTFSCATEDVEYVSEVKCYDVSKYYTNEISLAACYDISVTAMKTGFANSDVATAKLYWLTSSGSLDSSINAAKTRGVVIHSADGFVTISGLDSSEKVDFFSSDGKALGSAKAMGGTATFAAQSGSVVVAKIGKESVKIAVK